MRTLIFLLAFALIAPPALFAGQESATKIDPTKLPPGRSMLSPAICGKGAFLLTVGDHPIGRETFEIKCQPGGGYAASGRTEFKPPAPALELDTTLEVDNTGALVSATTKGTMAGTPLDQSVIIKGSNATFTNNGKSQELTYAKGTAFLGPNIIYMFQFLLAHYDVARGGPQQLSVFPNVAVKAEYTARDQVKDAAAPAKSTDFDRYSVVIGAIRLVAWVDVQGRLAAVAVPAQNFGAMREEYAGFVESLKAVLASKLNGASVDYSAPPGAAFTSEEITVQAKGFTLAGTLLLPKAGKRPLPAVITITGSGQQTRDEALPLAGLENYKPFRQIAETLASRGIAVLRVDDRGVGKSKGIETLEAATSSDFADDVRAQVNYLRSRGDIDPDRIALVGHSEGGLIAPMVAAADSRIAAIVLMAGTAKRGDAIITYQLNEGLEQDATLTAEQRARTRAEQEEGIRKAIESGDMSKLPPPLRGAWMKEFMSYDPLPTIRKVRQPILILQGALDRQVTAEQAAMLEHAARESGNKDVTLRVFPNLNHLFLPARTGAVSEYSSLGTTTIGDEVLSLLSDWLRQKLAVSK